MFQTEATGWQLNADYQAAFDPLLECLVVLTKHFDNPYTRQSLLTGLPLTDNKLDPETFLRAAERAQLSANIVKVGLHEIDNKILPAILLLENHQAYVLIDIKADGSATVIQPESGSGINEVSLDELKNQYVGYSIFIKPAYQFDSRAKDTTAKSKRHWFWHIIRRAWPIYSEIIIASFIINCFALATPLFIRNVYDRVIPNLAFETLWVLAAGVAIAFLFDFILRNIRAYFIDSTSKRIDIQLSRSIFERLLALEMVKMPNSVGSLVNTMHAYENFKDFITASSVSTIVDIPFAILFIAVIGLISGTMMYIPITAIVITLVISSLIQWPLAKIVRKNFKHATEKQAVLIESLGSIETIKTLCAESPMQRRWERINTAAAKQSIKAKVLSNLSQHFAMFAQSVTTISIVIYGVYQIAEGNLSMGGLIACTILTARAIGPFTKVANLITRYQHAKTALDAVNELMSLPVERQQDKRFLHRPAIHGNIQFNNVSFSYPNQSISALQNINLQINEGEHIGIIGRTGSGKTTLEKMMLKLYQPTSGSILVDGTDLNQIDPADLRHFIGYVPQDVLLFHGSIKHNITIGAPHVEDSEILRVAQLSGVSQFVDNHPEGYERQVGERGNSLSGGQRQAVALARALLQDPPILLLDEPTNGMDDTTSSQFIQLLKEQLGHKTLVLITHKASLLDLVDKIIVLDQGKLIAQGPKETILKRLSENHFKAKDNVNHKKDD